MFPEPVRNVTYNAAAATQIGVKNLYCFSRSAFWVVFSTSIILFAPVIFEVERAQMEEMQRNQQKQVFDTLMFNKKSDYRGFRQSYSFLGSI